MLVIVKVKPDSSIHNDLGSGQFIGMLELPFIGSLSANGDSEQEVRENLIQQLEDAMHLLGITNMWIDANIASAFNSVAGYLEINHNDELHVLRKNSHGI